MLTLRASNPFVVRTNTVLSPLIDCSAVLGTTIAAGASSVGISAVTKNPGRHLREALSTEATTRAARVSLSSSGLMNMMVAGELSPPPVTVIC